MSEPREDAPLTEQQRQLMAYVDDELSSEERARFEAAMTDDTALAREATKLRNIMDLSRSMAMTEPSDLEMRRFWARFYNRTEWRLGWVMFTAGTVVLLGEGLYLMMTSNLLTMTQKVATISTVIGGLLLLWNTVRLKLRTTHFDRYRGVMR